MIRRGVAFVKLSIEHVKDYIQIGVGLSFISGGIITVAALFSGGDDTPATAESPPTATVMPTAAASVTYEPTLTATLDPTPAPVSQGQFLTVLFGAEQDPLTLLPTGESVGPEEDIEVCPGGILYSWVEHSFRDGDVIRGRLTSRVGTLYSDSVPVDERAPNFWMGVQISETGVHTVHVEVEGGAIEKSWSVNVTCSG